MVGCVRKVGRAWGDWVGANLGRGVGEEGREGRTMFSHEPSWLFSVVVVVGSVSDGCDGVNGKRMSTKGEAPDDDRYALIGFETEGVMFGHTIL